MDIVRHSVNNKTKRRFTATMLKIGFFSLFFFAGIVIYFMSKDYSLTNQNSRHYFWNMRLRKTTEKWILSMQAVFMGISVLLFPSLSSTFGWGFIWLLVSFKYATHEFEYRKK